jgi:hypothetical protein
MKWSCVLFVSVAFSSVAVLADGVTPVVRVRALDPWAIESFERIAARSPLARQLIHRLEQSDLIVHIVTATVMPSNVAGTTRFVSRQGSYRYVRVAIDRQLLPESRAAILGHELQHALEIAVSDAADHDGVRRLYQRIGHRVAGREHFETLAAMTAGRRVWSELHDLSGVSWFK